MSEQTLATVKQIYNGLQTADIKAVLELFDPSSEIFTPGSLPWSTGYYSGLDGALAYFTSALGHVEETRFEVEDWLPSDGQPSGDWVTALGWWYGRALPSGNEFRVRFVHFWTLRDGKVVRAEGVSDTAGIINAFGPSLTASA